MKNKINVIELFGGISSFKKALNNSLINYELIDYVENNPNVVEIYNNLYQENQKPSSVMDYHLPKDVKIDILFHGSPCVDFSIAGRQLGGKKGSKTRSSLLYETLRILKEVSHHNLPKIVIWENVPNVLNKKHKEVFNDYLNQLSALGYFNYYEVLNAKNFGIPQKRERIFVVSVLDQKINVFNDLKRTKTTCIKSFIDLDDTTNFFHKTSQKRLFNNLFKISNFNEIENYFDITNSINLLKFKTTGVCKLKWSNFNQEQYFFDIENPNTLLNTFTAQGDNSKLKLLINVNLFPKNLLSNPDLIYLKIQNNLYLVRVINIKEAFALMGFNFPKSLLNNVLLKSKKTHLRSVIGNSIVVNVLEAIIQNLKNQQLI
ncbi:DNA cytosine methyltransferase [[Mycoplasma] anseris]|uniref:Cytosine-specific methyltransferase n=1 Tax=[Mycoplasma] anseris TaxID=92400 RepID=A0A2Z4ND95_9BACT|nr:DNA cytosine methyltransferase [[Mycoplasma] anseris]AWX69553.1 DNA (cytosine-5-)-methyltransferase [[Mycoplasma] anseris]